jgi:hypothetical protein
MPGRVSIIAFRQKAVEGDGVRVAPQTVFPDHPPRRGQPLAGTQTSSAMASRKNAQTCSCRDSSLDRAGAKIIKTGAEAFKVGAFKDGKIDPKES